MYKRQVFDGTIDGETIRGDFAQAGATGTFEIARTGDVVVALSLIHI